MGLLEAMYPTLTDLQLPDPWLRTNLNELFVTAVTLILNSNALVDENCADRSQIPELYIVIPKATPGVVENVVSKFCVYWTGP